MKTFKLLGTVAPLLLLSSCFELQHHFALLPVALQSQQGTQLGNLSGVFDFVNSYSQGSVWGVTADTHKVYKVSLDPTNNYPQKVWNYAPLAGTTGGSRTFVSEAGLIFARLPASLYVVNENTPNTASINPIWTGAKPNSNARACATSYQVNGNSFVAVAWTSNDGTTGNTRMFTQFPIISTNNPKIPRAIDASQIIEKKLGTDPTTYGWAYGCFTDQGNKRFWATSNGGGGSQVYGVDLNSLSDISINTAPNAGKPIQGGANFANLFGDIAKGSGSYALSGDGYGNVLGGSNSGSTIYTWAHETAYNFTMASSYDQASLYAFPSQCGSGTMDCSNSIFTFSTTAYSPGGTATGNIGPLSSLNDGRLIGIARSRAGSGGSTFYLLEPVLKTDISQGLKATNIGKMDGDGYMYTDFTGATLYPKPIDLTVDLTQMKNFDPKGSLQSVNFSWIAESGLQENWVGLNVQARCFNSSTQATSALASIDKVNPSSQVTAINVPSCQQPGFDHVEIVVSSNGASTFSRASSVNISAVEQSIVVTSP